MTPKVAGVQLEYEIEQIGSWLLGCTQVVEEDTVNMEYRREFQGRLSCSNSLVSQAPAILFPSLSIVGRTTCGLRQEKLPDGEETLITYIVVQWM